MTICIFQYLNNFVIKLVSDCLHSISLELAHNCMSWYSSNTTCGRSLLIQVTGCEVTAGRAFIYKLLVTTFSQPSLQQPIILKAWFICTLVAYCYDLYSGSLCCWRLNLTYTLVAYCYDLYTGSYCCWRLNLTYILVEYCYDLLQWKLCCWRLDNSAQ